jgi:hypothetical protein
MNLIKLFCLLIFTMPENIFAQEELEKKLPTYCIYASASISAGLRVGGIIQIHDNLGLEGSFGKDIANFIGPSDPNLRYSFGITIFPNFNYSFIINTTYSFIDYLSDTFNFNNEYIISLNVGSFDINKRGLIFFYKAGINLKNINSYQNNNSFIYYPNFDIGIGYIF